MMPINWEDDSGERVYVLSLCVLFVPVEHS
jgi:hypothetical protein